MRCWQVQQGPGIAAATVPNRAPRLPEELTEGGELTLAHEFNTVETKAKNNVYLF